MLGRPVARRLARENISVRVMARNPDKARTALSGVLDFVAGNLESVDAVDKAMQGCDAVYISVDTPPKSKFKPETDGLKNVLDAARNHGRPRLLLLSAYGHSNPLAQDHPWWHVREKFKAQQLAIHSGLPWTIFEPTWVMESLPLFVKGKTFTSVKGSRMKPYWVAGDDLGRIVSAALKEKNSQEKHIPVQGPENLSLEEAGRRFIHAYDRSMRIKSIPLFFIRAAGLFSAQAKDFATLMDVSNDLTENPPHSLLNGKLPSPSMTVEAYAGYCRATGDFPQK